MNFEGTGKTYVARKIAETLGNDNVEVVQFHPSYNYEDFVHGLRPTIDGKFEYTPGPFM